MCSVELAIIIPAFKAKYFRYSLESLRKQTRKDFNIYVCDDDSPDDLKSIVDEFIDLPIIYHKFKNNLGCTDLVGQWNRCVSISNSERWICLFSDDDIMDSRCVEKFYEIKSNSHVEVFRFNTIIIDENNQSFYPAVFGPSFETSESMAYYLLMGERGNSMPDHIFSRNVYEKNGGFVKTDFGQAADWATSILFSKEKGIQIIPNAILYWRRSDLNITSNAFKNREVTIKGYYQFIYWVVNHFAYLKNNENEITYFQMIQAIRANFLIVIIKHYKGLSLNQYRKTFYLMRTYLQLSRIQCLFYFIKIFSKTCFNFIIVLKFKRLIGRIFNTKK